jgi:hypothetical protein
MSSARGAVLLRKLAKGERPRQPTEPQIVSSFCCSRLTTSYAHSRTAAVNLFFRNCSDALRLKGVFRLVNSQVPVLLDIPSSAAARMVASLRDLPKRGCQWEE